jgi:uncharacterized protein YbjQ (UPF0145 family)
MNLPEQSSSFVVTTTPNLEGWTIRDYVTVVSCHVVTGTGVVSDIAASFSDFFGGRSDSYRRQLESIDAEAIATLREKAQAVGANALVGLRVQYAEISGNDKQMFMCTAQGTAVFAERSGADVSRDFRAKVWVEASELKALAQREHMLSRLMSNEDGWLSEDAWKFIGQHRAAEFLPWILRSLGSRSQVSRFGQDFVSRATKFVSLFPREEVRSQVCRAAASVPDPAEILSVVRDLQLLDIDVAISLLSEDDSARARIGAVLLRSDKASYSPQDIPALDHALQLIEKRFPRLAPIVEERGIFGTKRLWHCPACKKACPVESQICECLCDCFGFNGLGSTRNDVVATLTERIDLLRRAIGFPEKP